MTYLVAAKFSRTHHGTWIAARFALLSWIDIGVEIADEAGALARRYLASHSGIDTADYLIGAAAQSSGAKLITPNVKHFPIGAP